MEIKTLQQAMRASWVGAYRGLAMQGWRRASNLAGACFWRRGCPDGPNGELRCAVGWLIPNAHLEANGHKINPTTGAVSGSSIEATVNPSLLAPPLAAWLTRADRRDSSQFEDFLFVLQEAHDNGRTPAEMRANLEHVRERFNLGPLPTLPVAS